MYVAICCVLICSAGFGGMNKTQKSPILIFRPEWKWRQYVFFYLRMHELYKAKRSLALIFVFYSENFVDVLLWKNLNLKYAGVQRIGR